MRFAIFALDTFVRTTKRPVQDALQDTQRALGHISNGAASVELSEVGWTVRGRSTETVAMQYSDFMMER